MGIFVDSTYARETDRLYANGGREAGAQVNSFRSGCLHVLGLDRFHDDVPGDREHANTVVVHGEWFYRQIPALVGPG